MPLDVSETLVLKVCFINFRFPSSFSKLCHILFLNHFKSLVFGRTTSFFTVSNDVPTLNLTFVHIIFRCFSNYFYSYVEELTFLQLISNSLPILYLEISLFQLCYFILASMNRVTSTL